MDSLVVLREVKKTYSRGRQTQQVLNGIDLEIGRGEFLALVGPSGSGKSTVLNLIAGLDRPSGGEIRIDGERVDQLSDIAQARWRARHVGFVFQFYHLLPRLAAEANVELALLLSRLNRAERRRRVSIALQLVGLADRAKHKPAELSGGEQQRVAIARAIVTDPTLLICDEPTGDLDRQSADEVMRLLRELNLARGKTIVLVTHDPIAASYGSREIRLDKGKLTAPVPAHSSSAPGHESRVLDVNA